MRHLLLCVLLLLPSSMLAQTRSERIGSFSVVPNTDQMTDEDRSFAFTMPISGSDGISSLRWHCMDDGLNVLVRTKYLSGDSDDEVRVTYRFMPDPASAPTYWRDLGSNEDWWMPMRLVPAFTEAARSRAEIILRVVDPLDGETLTATFSLDGLDLALAKLPCYRSQPR